MRKKAQTSKERELPKALLKNDKDNISEGNLDKKNKRKNKKDKSKELIVIECNVEKETEIWMSLFEL